MPSAESQQIKAMIVAASAVEAIPIEEQRRQWEEASSLVELPPEIQVDAIDVGGIPAEWITSKDIHTNKVLLYFHGGGYSLGSCITHRYLASRLVQATQVRVLTLDYRLAPQHPFPAAVDDATQSYHWLLNQGIAADTIYIGGDSAGGGLAMATLVKLRDEGVALPHAAILISPWLDLAMTGNSITTCANLDPMVSHDGLHEMAQLYLGESDPTTPLASPIYADLQGLPSLLIQVGSDEVLLDDSTRLAAKAKNAGVPVQLEVWDGMWHVWHGWANVGLPEADEAFEQIGRFVRQ
ncbi:MAG: alpha/beta hydrolase [Chloroflexota bacterium]